MAVGVRLRHDPGGLRVSQLFEDGPKKIVHSRRRLRDGRRIRPTRPISRRKRDGFRRIFRVEELLQSDHVRKLVFFLVAK
jgi:hypothetical protein